MKFDREGKLLLTLGKKGKPGVGDGQFNKPADVAFGAARRVLRRRRLRQLAGGQVLEGRQVLLKQWGKKGKGAGEFNLPHAICVDAKGASTSATARTTACRSSTRTASSSTQWEDSGRPLRPVL